MQRSKVSVILTVFAIAIALSWPAISSAAEDQDPAKEISGKIMSTNLKESSLSIQYLEDKKNQTYHTSIFYVNDDSDIVRAEDPCELADLKQGENVLIEYMHDPSGKDMIVTLSVDAPAAVSTKQ